MKHRVNGGWPNESPRVFVMQLAARPALGDKKSQHTELEKKILRGQSAQANGFENASIFGVALLCGIVAKLPGREMNMYAVSYLLIRAVYNWLYVMTSERKYSYIRTIVFQFMIAIYVSLFARSAFAIAHVMKKFAMHPKSRSAYQHARISFRQRRLHDAKQLRNAHRSAKVDRIMTFILLLSESKTHLPDLYAFHDFICTFYLGRHQEVLEGLRNEQRPGRPKNKQLSALENLIAVEEQEYYEGVEVPDLTNAANVELLREWKGDPQALPNFRFVRISGAVRDMFTVVQEGNHKRLQESL
ncbi:translation machinery-associated protein 16 [Malassezia vespertilionis]|nr:translation machinery-associated protein 16 [Malassezia vespertilionis]WFD07335.1 translation machinery-associated protein 16 [Malassezia vespertilionis]